MQKEKKTSMTQTAGPLLRFHDGDFHLFAANAPRGVIVFRVRADRQPLERFREKRIDADERTLRPATPGEIAAWAADHAWSFEVVTNAHD